MKSLIDFGNSAKVCLTILVALITHSLVAQERKPDSLYHFCFFPKTSFIVGLAAPYSSELQKAGINARLYYNANEKFCFGPEFSFFKEGAQELWDVNIVMHYIFKVKWIGIYPVAGANYSHKQESQVEESGFGVILGAGVHRNFKKLTTFMEYASVRGKLNDQFLTIGFYYKLR